MSEVNSDLNKKVAESIIKLIRIKDALVDLLNDKSFLTSKLSEKSYERLVTSLNAIDIFLQDLCDKLECSEDELRATISTSEDLYDVASEDIESLIDFLIRKNINWKIVLIALGAFAATVLCLVASGVATPLGIALTAGGSGLIAAVLSIIFSRMVDDLDCFATESRMDLIKRAHNLHKQFLIFGKYPFFTKIQLQWSETFQIVCRKWNWET